MKHGWNAIIAIIVIGFFVFLPAVNSWENEVAICTTSETQVSAAICSDGAGGAIIVWTDYRGSTLDLYASKINSSGVKQWTFEQGDPICTENNTQWLSRIISDEAGGAIVVWEDKRDGTPDIYGDRIDPTGTSLWGVNGTPICVASGGQYAPRLCSDGAGGAIFVWLDNRGAKTDIYAQKFNASGVPQWNINGIPVCNAEEWQEDFQLISDGSGGAIFVWEDMRNTDDDIYTQRIDSEGSPKWALNGTVICIMTGYQRNPRLCTDGAGGAIIAWADGRYGGGTEDIYIQKIDNNGVLKWTTNGKVLCNAENYQGVPILLSDGLGGAFIVWRDDRSGSEQTRDIYGQRIDSSGTPLWAPNGTAICQAADKQIHNDICSDNMGGFIVAWQDNRSGNYDVYAQRITSAGTPLWGNNGTVICNAIDDQENTRLCLDAAGGVMFVWIDHRSGTNYDIYAQRILLTTGDDGIPSFGLFYLLTSILALVVIYQRKRLI